MLKLSVFCLSVMIVVISGQDETTPLTTPAAGGDSTTGSTTGSTSSAGSTGSTGSGGSAGTTSGPAGSVTASGAPGGANATGGSCTDQYQQCPYWKSQDQCKANEKWMMENCAAACTECQPKMIKIASCTDSVEKCRKWAFEGECFKNTGYMIDKCPKSCLWCNHDGSGTTREYPFAVKYMTDASLREKIKSSSTA